MIYPNPEKDTIKLSDDALTLAICIKANYNKRHSDRGPTKGWVNGVAMPHSAEMGEQSK